MILIAETSLLKAVRQRLIDGLGLETHVVDLELDDQAPAMAGDVYYSISPAGAAPGRHSDQGNAITHNVFGVRICVLMRVADVPRDRTRNSAFLDRLESINFQLSEVSRVLRLDYPTIELANANLANRNISGKFKTPLRPKSVDAKPVMVTSDTHGGTSGNNGGNAHVIMKRGMNFGGAEYLIGSE